MIWILCYSIFFSIFSTIRNSFVTKGKNPHVIIMFFKFQDTLIDCRIHRPCLRNTASYLALLNWLIAFGLPSFVGCYLCLLGQYFSLSGVLFCFFFPPNTSRFLAVDHVCIWNAVCLPASDISISCCLPLRRTEWHVLREGSVSNLFPASLLWSVAP